MPAKHRGQELAAQLARKARALAAGHVRLWRDGPLPAGCQDLRTAILFDPCRAFPVQTLR